MSRTLRLFVYLLLLLAAFGGGILAMRYYYRSQQPQASEEAVVLLERINKVAKLITVEGEFSELYRYQDYQYYDISPLRKRAILRVNARVSMGYDFSNLTIVPDYETRTLYISDLPDPEILSIDHDVSYYDIQEGVFNYFDEREQTELAKRAKVFIEEKAKQSRLTEAAVEQGNELLELITYLAQTTGWEVQYRTRHDPPVPVLSN